MGWLFMSDKIEYGLQNVKKAVGELKKYLAEPVVTARDRAGIIQAFEFSYETIWKLLQKIAEGDGLSVNSPREAFSFGFQKGLVHDQKIWLAMIRHRNLTTHVYREEIAEEVHRAIAQSYANEWDLFLVRIEQK